MIIGSFFTVPAGVCLVITAALTADVKIGLFWPVMFHLLSSNIGCFAFCRSKPGLVHQGRAAKITSTVVGLYYLSFFIANALVGKIGEALLVADDQLLAAPCRRGDPDWSHSSYYSRRYSANVWRPPETSGDDRQQHRARRRPPW